MSIDTCYFVFFFLPGKTDVFTQPMYINKYLYCITTLLVFFFNFFCFLFVCSFARTVAIFATTIITTNLQGQILPLSPPLHTGMCQQLDSVDLSYPYDL